MRWKMVNVPLGVCDTPFGTLRKCAGEAELVGGLFGAAASLYNTSKTNEANEWMNWQTNEANRQINEAQLAWAREQYQQEVAENRFLVDQAYQRELENRQHNEEYNSPKALASRYRAAGINPYLAMYGGSSMGHAGGSGSIGSQTGVNPHANQPNMIPMQQGSPAIPSGFGTIMASAIQGMAENDIKRDALNEQIAARVQQNELDYMKLMDDLSSNKVQREFLHEQINDMHRKFAFESDKLALEKDWNNFQKYVQQYQLEQRDKEIQISNFLANSKIALDSATISELASNVLKTKQEIFEMNRKGDSEQSISRYIEKQQRINAEILERDNERQKRQNSTSARRAYADFTDWLFTPIKGLVNIGIK